MSKKSKATTNENALCALRGARSLAGDRWLRIRQGKQQVWVKLAHFMTDPSSVKDRLADADIILLGGDWRALQDDVKEPRQFPPANIVDYSGWTGPLFALPSGDVFSPDGAKGHSTFQPDTEKCASSGSLDGWLERVAEPLADQMLAVFMLMVMFVAPLLKLTHRSGNFGFELIGETTTGKSMMLQIMASIAGGATEDTPSIYWNSCNTTVNALEKKIQAHSDMPMLLDDATSFAAELGSSRGHPFKKFVFDLAQGETKDRLSGGKQLRFRTVYVLTSNQSLAEVIVHLAKKEADATMNRLFTFDVDLQHGVFEKLPDGFSGMKPFADSLLAAMAVEYGTAMPHFLQNLVDHRARNEQRLRSRIARYANEFASSVRVDPNDGSEGRVAGAFGLVLAAGQLARHYGSLPQSYDCQAATLAAYRLYMASVKRQSASARVLSYAGGPDIVDLDKLGERFLSKQQLRDAAGIFRSNRHDVREFLVDPKKFRVAFPDWSTVLRDERVARWLQREGRHHGQKREVCKGYPDDRFYCFKLPKSSSRCPPVSGLR